MAQKLYSLEEAAEILGITPDQLTQHRERNKLAGVRVGTNWKFKPQEVERFAHDLAGDDDEVGLADSDSGELVDLAPPDAGGSSAGKSGVVLLSEATQGDSSASTSSTVIGKSPRPGGARQPDSDVKLVKGDSDLQLKSAAKAAPLADAPLEASDEFDMVDLTMDEERGGSGVLLDLGAKPDDSSTNQKTMLGGSDVLGSLGPAGSSILMTGSDKAKSSGKGEGSGSKKGGARAGDDEGIALTDSKVRKAQDSGLNLGGSDFEDDDLVLGTLTGSDVGINPSDSGISLTDPSDSGLSLEEPLELGTDDSGLVNITPDDTFELTPTMDSGEDDSSGSQVIALDSESSFDDAAATMLGSEDMGGGATMLEEEPMAADDFGGPAMGMPGMAPMGMAPGGMPMGAPGMMPGPAAVTVETPYSVWNVLSLSACLLVLTLTGLMMFDLMRNIWSWDGPYAVNSSMMNMIVGLFE